MNKREKEISRKLRLCCSLVGYLLYFFENCPSLHPWVSKLSLLHSYLIDIESYWRYINEEKV